MKIIPNNFYIKKNGDLYIQLRKSEIGSLLKISKYLSYYHMFNISAHIVAYGRVTKITKSGFILEDWIIR